MRRLYRYAIPVIFWFCCLSGLQAQQYTGMSGLIHVPTADMDKEGDIRIGAHFLNREMTPDESYFYSNGKKYHTFSHYLSITPFSWVEIGYTCTLLRKKSKPNSSAFGHYEQKDRYFSAKLRPLKEGKWWPSLAVGFNDYWDSRADVSGEGGELYFGNIYVAATKHIEMAGHEWGIHVAYREYRRDYNSKWNGVVGGITYNPSFARNLRGIVEYTGNEINIGADCLLWKHLLLQASLQDGKYFSGGVCFQMNLF